MRNRPAVALIIGVIAIATITSCGPGSTPVITTTTNSPPGSILFLVAPPSSLAINASTTVNAAVPNDDNAVISWSLACGSAGACGSLGFTQTPGNQNNTYTAPAAIPSGTSVTITATLVGDTTNTISAKITITPPVPITVSFLGVTPASLQVSATTTLRAEISNDTSANPEVSWSVTCGSSSCGSFNPATTTSEAPTAYTAPSAIPSGNSVTVKATSVTDPTKSASATIDITAAAPTLAGGTYVFHVSGPVGTAANSVSGVFVAQHGVITGGEQDLVNYAVDQNAEQNSFFFDSINGGSYSTSPDGNLQITLATNDPNFPSEIFGGVIISSSQVLLTESNGAVGSGTLDLQASKSAPSGSYAFSTFGVDLYGQPAGIGGVLNVSASGGLSSGSLLDINDNFTFLGSQSLGSSSNVSTPDQFGRVVFQLTPPASSNFLSLSLAGYIVDSNRIRLVETAGDGFQGVMGGTALSQGTNAGTFSNASIAGSSYVFALQGVGSDGSLQVAGVFTANSDGSLNGTLNWNDFSGKATQTPASFTGSYSVDPTGRATLSNLTDGTAFNYQLEFYLTGTAQGLMLSSDTGQMIVGRAFQQQAGTFSASSFNGSYGFALEQVPGSGGIYGEQAAVGPVNAAAGNGIDTLTGFLDFSNGPTDSGLSGSLNAASSGIFTGTLSGLNTSSLTTADNVTFYLIDATQAVMIETDNAQLALGYLGLQQ